VDILQVTGITFAGALGTGASEVTQTVSTLPSALPSLSELSLLDLSPLSDLQPDTFNLATISFEAVNPGFAAPRFSIDSLIFSDGSVPSNKFFTTKIGVTVQQRVPEPESFLLLLSGLAGLVGMSRLPLARRLLPRRVRA